MIEGQHFAFRLYYQAGEKNISISRNEFLKDVSINDVVSVCMCILKHLDI